MRERTGWVNQSLITSSLFDYREHAIAAFCRCQWRTRSAEAGFNQRSRDKDLDTLIVPAILSQGLPFHSLRPAPGDRSL
jgi:hypothetical protein